MVDDYKNRDPYNPPPVNSGLGGPGAYDQYGNARFEPVDESGRGPYILLGILVAIGVIGGLLYFNHAPMDRQQAQAPTVTDTRPAPVTPAAPGAAPLAPALPRTTPASPSDAGTATPSAPVRQ